MHAYWKQWDISEIYDLPEVLHSESPNEIEDEEYVKPKYVSTDPFYEYGMSWRDFL